MTEAAFPPRHPVPQLPLHLVNPVAVLPHALATVRAIQAERAGKGLEAAALYEDAAVRWERFTELPEQAHALLGQGRCLAAAGGPAADLPVRRARTLFDQMGARRRVDECDSLIAKASRLTS
jgi:hypothetical protein